METHACTHAAAGARRAQSRTVKGDLDQQSYGYSVCNYCISCTPVQVRFGYFLFFLSLICEYFVVPNDLRVHARDGLFLLVENKP